MGLMSKLVEGRRTKATAFVRDQLGTDEQPDAVLPMTQTRNPLAAGAQFYGIVALPTQVVMVGYPKLVETPNAIVASWDRDSVAIESWKRGVLMIRHPQGTTRLEVPRIHRKDAEALVAALGGTVS